MVPAPRHRMNHDGPPGPGRRWVRITASAAVGYAAGMVPSADVAAKMASGGRIDLREHGSGNPGGANAVAVLGPGWGYGVMAADIAKGAVASRIGRRLAGFAAVVGHCYPMTKGFPGGSSTDLDACFVLRAVVQAVFRISW